jgi:Protein of unknown function (DUF1524)
MSRRRWVWLFAAVVIVLFVAFQPGSTMWRQHSEAFAATADTPRVAAGTDILAGVAVLPVRVRGHDYRRASFGENWTDDNDAPLGRNGCDTRNDILDRDLVGKTYVPIKRCPHAVAAGTLHDPYTNGMIWFTRGEQAGASVQIDHIVPLALAWDLGARGWTEKLRVRFANDPANLLAVDGPANQDKGDKEPSLWMPPNHAFWCQYSVQFAEILRGYALPIDHASADVLRAAASTCPTA